MIVFLENLCKSVTIVVFSALCHLFHRHFSHFVHTVAVSNWRSCHLLFFLRLAPFLLCWTTVCSICIFYSPKVIHGCFEYVASKLNFLLCNEVKTWSYSWWNLCLRSILYFSSYYWRKTRVNINREKRKEDSLVPQDDLYFTIVIYWWTMYIFTS